MTRGYSRKGCLPPKMWKSVPQTPIRRMCTRTSPGAGSGSGRSIIARRPGVSQITAFIATSSFFPCCSTAPPLLEQASSPKIPWARLVAPCSLAEWGAEPPTRERPCKPSVLDLTNTPLSAPISTRSSCPSNSAVQPGSSPPSLRAAARRYRSIRCPASKHTVRSGDIAALLARLSQLKEKARARTGRVFPIIVIQEAGLDGFWIHRVLQSEGIETHVVDPASIATSRRRRRAKTDRIDGEALVRTLLAYKRGEPRA